MTLNFDLNIDLLKPPVLFLPLCISSTNCTQILAKITLTTTITKWQLLKSASAEDQHHVAPFPSTLCLELGIIVPGIDIYFCFAKVPPSFIIFIVILVLSNVFLPLFFLDSAEPDSDESSVHQHFYSGVSCHGQQNQFVFQRAICLSAFHHKV